MGYEFTADDLAKLKKTVEAAVQVAYGLEQGKLPPMLRNLEWRLRKESGPQTEQSAKGVQLQRCWRFEAWDGFSFSKEYSRYGCCDVSDPYWRDQVVQRFNACGLDLHHTTDGRFDSSALSEMVKAHDWLVTLRLKSQDKDILGLGLPEVYTEELVLPHGDKEPRFNKENGEFIELTAKKLAMNLAKVMRHELIGDVIIDSEMPYAVTPGEISTGLAAKYGVDLDSTLAPADAIVDENSDIHKAKWWEYERANHLVIDKTVSAIIRATWPSGGPRLIGSYEYNPFEAVGWAGGCSYPNIGKCPNSPLSVAHRVESARAKFRFCGIDDPAIIVGSQLGVRFTVNGRTVYRPVPPDLFTTACWHSFASGSRGVSGWGLICIFKLLSEGGGFRERGEEFWHRLARIRRELVDRHGPLGMRWNPVPARIAILRSLVYDAHLDQSDSITENPQLWRHQHAEENVYRALRLAGYQPEIVFDDEVSGLLDCGITALIIPDLEICGQKLVDAIKAFYWAGGTVIRHEGCVVPVGDILSCDPIAEGSNPNNLAPKFWFWSPISYQQFRDWELRLADALTERLERGGLRPRFPRSDERAVASFLGLGGETCCVVVPDEYESGEYESWWAGLQKHPDSPTVRGKFCEVARSVAVRNTSGRTLIDIETGDFIPPEAQIDLLPAWGRVFRVL